MKKPNTSAVIAMGLSVRVGEVQHQGERECARRLRTHQEKKPRRMWVMSTHFGKYKCSRRAPLAKNYCHKILGYPIVLEGA